MCVSKFKKSVFNCSDTEYDQKIIHASSTTSESHSLSSIDIQTLTRHYSN